jgi:ribosomal protein L11 methyltransferase
MQVETLLEMKVPADSISEPSFIHITRSLNAVGYCEQKDEADGREFRIAWFRMDGDAKLTRARIVASALLAGVCSEDIEVQTLDDHWESAWKTDWKPVETGERLRIRPSFCGPVSDDRIEVVLDPGMAFGTGQHATTRLCLAAIEQICSDHAPQSMLDMGCGSGLLAIAAAKLGVPHIVAMDHDPVAIEVARENAAINKVKIRFELGDAPPNRKFDLVVANILANPLIEMASALAASTGQYLVLSGLMESQLEDVSRPYLASGLHITKVERESEWALIELQPVT